MEKSINFLLVVSLFILFVNTLSAQEIYVKKSGRKYSYVNQAGDRVIDQKFEDAKEFIDRRAAVLVDGYWGYIDTKGAFVIEPQYIKANNFRYRAAIVETKDGYSVINTEGETITSMVYDSIYRSQNAILLKENQLYGILDSTGQLLVEPKYESINCYYNGKYTVKLDGKWGELANGKENFEVTDFYFNKPEVMPLFSGKCKKEKEDKKLHLCSERKMLEALYRNIKYPAEARENGVMGMVLIQFVITKDAKLINPVVIRGIGGGCDQESLKIVKEYLSQWYKPGYQDGQAVNTIFHFPVKFKLE